MAFLGVFRTHVISQQRPCWKDSETVRPRTERCGPVVGTLLMKVPSTCMPVMVLGSDLRRTGDGIDRVLEDEWLDYFK
jgi:hypothetical protein